MTAGHWLARELADTRGWTLKLLADFAGEDWTWQPGPGLAHGLWLAGHLAVAQDLLIHRRCLNQSVVDDGFAAHFPIGRPVAAVGEHAYPGPDEVLATMAEVHERTLAAVAPLADDFLAQPAFGKDGAAHPHYTDKRGAIAHASRHEAFHAGQLATIRRLRGKAFLR